MKNTSILSLQRSVWNAYFVLGVGVVATSSAATLIKLAQAADVPSIFIASGRLTIAALILTPAMLHNENYRNQIRSLSRSDLRLTLWSGVFLAIHFAAWVSSLKYTTVLISIVLVSTTPLWVALLEVLFLKARLSRLIIGGLVIAFIGGLVIGLSGTNASQAEGGNDLQGALLSLIGAFAVAVYLIIGRRVRSRLTLAPYIWLVYGTAALSLLAVLTVTRTAVLGYELKGYVWILALALFPQLVGHSSFNYALAYLPATLVSVAGQMEPVFGSILAIVILSEIPVFGQVIGGVIIILGVLLSTTGSYRQHVSQQSGN